MSFRRKITRRQFIKGAAIAGGAMMLPIKWFGRGTAYAFGQSPSVPKFTIPLPGLGPGGIPVASPTSMVDPVTNLLTDYYTITARQSYHDFHPDLPGTGSKIWGYAPEGGVTSQGYLGGVIVAQKDRPVRLKVKNKLPKVHPLPVDKTIMGAESSEAENRMTVHLHGGLVPWNSDGGPYSWFTPGGLNYKQGVSFKNPGPVQGSAEYYYPNQQSARLVWYHDHALGITRLNAYAGLASAYIIRDPIEQALIRNNVIPSREIPLVLQDKTFVDGTDPNYTRGVAGDLWYPYLYEPDRWAYGPNEDPPRNVIGLLPSPSVVPEFFSDTIVVNGAVYPYARVEPRHYRFRILNGSQARFYNLQLYYADSSSGTEANLANPGPRMIQIGTEGGFLPRPVALKNQQIGFDLITGNANQYTLLLAPGERADVIIDFSSCSAGSKLILYSDAPAPFPMGDPLNDYTTQGTSPNTRTLLQFQVVPRVGAKDPPSLSFLELIANGSLGVGALAGALLPAIEKCDLRQATRVRDLTLNEDFDEYGRLIQFLGTNVATGSGPPPVFGRKYDDAPTETPEDGDMEVWRIFNLTGDTHPIHFHLVNVQVLSRRPFDAASYKGTPAFTGPARNPDANELGWKETVRMNPGEMTEVVMKFDLPKGKFMNNLPLSTRTGVTGHEYVWHCHILEHEEHDMMRPLIVKP
jgi:spore coat protein A